MQGSCSVWNGRGFSKKLTNFMENPHMLVDKFLAWLYIQRQESRWWLIIGDNYFWCIVQISVFGLLIKNIENKIIRWEK